MTRKKFEQVLMENAKQHNITFVSELSFDTDGMVTMMPSAKGEKVLIPIRWIPIVPLSTLFGNHPCYKDKICINKKGERFKGISCCEKMMPDYHRRRFDTYNYVPEINLYASKLKPTADNSHPNLPPKLRGYVARTYLHMMRKYHLTFSYDVIRQYEEWHRDYPAEKWEKQRGQV